MANNAYITVKKKALGWQPSLGFKYIILIGTILSFTLFISSAFIFSNHRQLGDTFTKEKATLVGDLFTQISKHTPEKKTLDRLNTYLKELSQNGDIVYSALFGANNAKIVSYLGSTQKKYSVLNDDKVGDLTQTLNQLNKHPSISPYSFPINTDKKYIGTAVIGIEIDVDHYMYSQPYLNQWLINILIIFAFSGFFYTVFRYYTLSPINNLITAAQKVASGELDHKVLIRGNDEIGCLAKSFNKMVVKLKNSKQETENAITQLRELNRNLEERVNNRTSELENTNKELQYLALHDPLTQLSNRALFNNRLQHSIQIARRENSQFSVVVIDLDKFKEINDGLGHLIGDKVLQAVGMRLSSALRTSDTVARLGGDEFALILPASDRNISNMIAKKILTAFEPPITAVNNSLSVGVSIGIAIFPEHGEDDTALLKHADLAMYQAKRSSTGYQFFDTKEDTKRLNRLQLIRDLDTAIHTQKLKLHYQPIIDLATAKICAVEALTRWQHPERGFIPPDEFISLAEQKGLIQALTTWVLNTACQQCAEWHKMGYFFSISVNLSTRNFLDPHIPDQIGNLLESLNLDPKWLCLEITESMTMSNPDRAMEILNTLDTMGIQLSIDDFGTGYSSLCYLKKLPVGEIKIDKSFVLGLNDDRDNKVIVRSTIDLAHSLGLKVVAEGVEHEKELELLDYFGADKVQGYYLCKPNSAKVINQWLNDSKWGIATHKAELISH